MDAVAFANHPHVARVFWMEALYDAFPCRFTFWLWSRAIAKAGRLRAECVGSGIEALARAAMWVPFRQPEMSMLGAAYYQGAMQAAGYVNASPMQQALLAQQMMMNQQRARRDLFGGLLGAANSALGASFPR